MRSVGIRELKEHASEIVRRVREDGEEVLVTYRGRAVALLVPVTPPQPQPSATDIATFLADLDQLAEEIGKQWPAGVTAAQAVSEDRRDL